MQCPKQAAHRDTPPEDVSRCRGRSPGSRVVTFTQPSRDLSPSGVHVRKLAAHSCGGSSGFGLSAPDSLLALTLGRQRTTTRRSMEMLPHVVNWGVNLPNRGRSSFGLMSALGRLC